METAIPARAADGALDSVLRAALADGHERSLPQLRTAVGSNVSDPRLARELSRLIQTGEVIRSRRGVYQLAPTGASAVVSEPGGHATTELETAIPTPRSSAESRPVLGRKLSAAPSRRVPMSRRAGDDHKHVGLVDYAPITDPVAKRPRPAPPRGSAPRRVALGSVTLPPSREAVPAPGQASSLASVSPSAPAEPMKRRVVTSRFPGPRRATLGPVTLPAAPAAPEQLAVPVVQPVVELPPVP
ncbi:MAG: hypothetical protein WCI74_20210, partial [Actinomycetes bacterium]